MKKATQDKIRIGVVGIGRGRAFMNGDSDLNGLELSI